MTASSVTLAPRGLDILRTLAETRLNEQQNTSNNSAVQETLHFMDVCTVDVEGNDLCRAVCLGAVRLVRTLVEGGFDMSSTNRDEQTALHVFCIRRAGTTQDDKAILKLLFEHQVPVNAVDRWGKSALIYAVGLRKSITLIRELLDHNADIFIEDHIGFSAMIYAYNCHEEALIKLFIEKCNEYGREMVVIESQLNANFLSYLKIQKLVGAERASVCLAPNAGGSSSTSQNPSSSPRVRNRRLSGLGGRFINLLNPSASATVAVPTSPHRRRSSMFALVKSPSISEKSNSGGGTRATSAHTTTPSHILHAPATASNARRHSLMLLQSDVQAFHLDNTQQQQHSVDVECDTDTNDGKCASCGAVRSSCDKQVECNMRMDRQLTIVERQRTVDLPGMPATILPQLSVEECESEEKL